jgi:hypothetical protein
MSLKPLAWSRAALGIVVFLRTTGFARLLPGIHLPPRTWLVGWPEEGFVPSLLHVPDSIVAILCIVRTVGLLLFCIGAFTRAAGTVAVVAGYLVMARDPFSFLFTFHIALLGVFVLSWVDSSTMFAVIKRKPSASSSSVALARAFVASVYFWSAIPKVRAPWLRGDVLRAYWDMGYGHHSLGRFLLVDHAQLSAIGALILELSLPFLLWVKRTRTIGLALACAMHATFEATLHPDILGFVMVALLVVFVDPLKRESVRKP